MSKYTKVFSNPEGSVTPKGGGYASTTRKNRNVVGLPTAPRIVKGSSRKRSKGFQPD